MHLDFQGTEITVWCRYYLSELCKRINSPSSLDFNYYSYSNFHEPTLLDWYWRWYFDNRINSVNSTSQESSLCGEIEEQGLNDHNEDYEYEISDSSYSTNRDLSNSDRIREEDSRQENEHSSNSLNRDDIIFCDTPGISAPNEYEIFDVINRILSKCDRIIAKDSNQHEHPSNSLRSTNRGSLSFNNIEDQEFNNFNEDNETLDSLPSINREFSKCDRMIAKDLNQHNEHPSNSLLSTDLGSFDIDESTDQDPKILNEGLGTLDSLQSTNDSSECHGTTKEDLDQQSENLSNSLLPMNQNSGSCNREFAKILDLMQNTMSLPETENHIKWGCESKRRTDSLDDILKICRIPKRQLFQPIGTIGSTRFPSLVTIMV